MFVLPHGGFVLIHEVFPVHTNAMVANQGRPCLAPDAAQRRVAASHSGQLQQAITKSGRRYRRYCQIALWLTHGRRSARAKFDTSASTSTCALRRAKAVLAASMCPQQV